MHCICEILVCFIALHKTGMITLNPALTRYRQEDRKSRSSSATHCLRTPWGIEDPSQQQQQQQQQHQPMIKQTQQPRTYNSTEDSRMLPWGSSWRSVAIRLEILISRDKSWPSRRATWDFQVVRNYRSRPTDRPTVSPALPSCRRRLVQNKRVLW